MINLNEICEKLKEANDAVELLQKIKSLLKIEPDIYLYESNGDWQDFEINPPIEEGLIVLKCKNESFSDEFITVNFMDDCDRGYFKMHKNDFLAWYRIPTYKENEHD